MNPTIAGLTAVAVLVSILAMKFFLRERATRLRFSKIVDVDDVVAKRTEAIVNRERESLAESTKHKESLAALVIKYAAAKEIFDRLTQKISLLEEHVEDMSFGVYSPHFDFSTSEEYRTRLESARYDRKQLIRSGEAAHCPVEWNVGGSKKDGARMMKQYTKVMLRAFNGETEAAIARVKWNNVTKMEERIRKAHEAINELGSTMQMSITPAYLKACLDELRLEYELEQKKYQELEEQRAIRERLREEEKAQREFDRAQREAEQDELRFQRALEKARVELDSAKDQERAELHEDSPTGRQGARSGSRQAKGVIHGAADSLRLPLCDFERGLFR
jgi:hypothetical protein